MVAAGRARGVGQPPGLKRLIVSEHGSAGAGGCAAQPSEVTVEIGQRGMAHLMRHVLNQRVVARQKCAGRANPEGDEIFRNRDLHMSPEHPVQSRWAEHGNLSQRVDAQQWCVVRVHMLRPPIHPCVTQSLSRRNRRRGQRAGLGVARKPDKDLPQP